MIAKPITLIAVIMSIFFLKGNLYLIISLIRKSKQKKATKTFYLKKAQCECLTVGLTLFCQGIFVAFSAIIGLCMKTIAFMCGKNIEEENKAETDQDKVEDELIRKIRSLRESGFKADKWDKKKILELVNQQPRFNLTWVSETTRIPIEHIVIIIEDEPDFEIQEEYIINKNKIDNEQYPPPSS